MNDIPAVDLCTPRDSDGPATSLMRPTDRARRTLRRAQLFLGALAVVAAVPVGTAAAQMAPDRTAGSDVRTVQAELLEPAPAPEIAVVGAATPTPARWTAPDGRVHTGLVWADAGLARGALVTVPADQPDGALSTPADTPDPRLTGLLAGVGTVLACWALLALAAGVWRTRLAARDTVGWTAGWARVEPVWSGRA